LKFYYDEYVQLEYFQHYKISFLFGLVGIFLFILAAVSSRMQGESLPDKSISIISEEDNQLESVLVVDVQGAVESPGLYEVSSATRVGELIEKAGGFSVDADINWISKQLNQAERVKDGMKLYIPFLDETGIEGDTTADYSSFYININKASVTELESLSGIGEKRAQDIVQNRPYASIEELVEKSVISQSLFDSIRETISVY
jgi:competence protein ComEA